MTKRENVVFHAKAIRHAEFTEVPDVTDCNANWAESKVSFFDNGNALTINIDDKIAVTLPKDVILTILKRFEQ